MLLTAPSCVQRCLYDGARAGKMRSLSSQISRQSAGIVVAEDSVDDGFDPLLHEFGDRCSGADSVSPDSCYYASQVGTAGDWIMFAHLLSLQSFNAL